jgi:hypothetical protein
MLIVSVFAMLVPAGYWWARLPERTMGEFKSLIAAEKAQEANSMINNDGAVPFRGSEFIMGGPTFRATVETTLDLERPSIVDLIIARRKCKHEFRDGLIVVYVNRFRLEARAKAGERLVFRVLLSNGTGGMGGGMGGYPEESRP